MNETTRLIYLQINLIDVKCLKSLLSALSYDQLFLMIRRVRSRERLSGGWRMSLFIIKICDKYMRFMNGFIIT